jgi:eukaryotic-like serine/threonine-protein kinase
MGACITLGMDRPGDSAADQSDSGLSAASGQAERSSSALTGTDDTFGLGDCGTLEPAFRPVPGTRIGDVTIGRLLAAGGMGCVYEGWQDAPRRRVALKLMRPRGSGGFSRRFAREIDVLASLRHPHIAQVHSCGTHQTDSGELPYYVMELVPDAESLTVYAVHHGLSIRERMALFGTVCAALAHAHARGVIHRDLKPANILVGSDGAPKLIDFGVARLLDTNSDRGQGEPTCATRAGELVGTLQYMSPEQIVGSSDIDERSDVYALGLVLHELVARRPPYDLSGRSYTESVRIVTGNAAATSVAVARAAAAEGNALDARALGVITSTCLEAVASDRYPSAARLEADVARWLDDRPILARPPTPWESARRFARRHRAVAWSGAAAVAALLVAVVGISLASLRASRLRHEAERQATVARQQLYTATLLLAAEARDRDNMAEARRLVGDAWQLAAATSANEPLELRCLEASLDEASEMIAGAEGTVAAVAWSPDGTWLAVGDAAGQVRLHRPGAAGMSAVGIGNHEGAIWSLAVSPDGQRLASAGADGRVRIWNVSTGACEAEFAAHAAAVYSVAFAPDGATLVSASRDRTARLWDTATWQERRVLRDHAGTVYAARFSADGRRLVTASMDRTARVWNADTGACEVTLSGHSNRVFSAGFSADGTAIVTASEDGTARIWNGITGEERQRLTHPFRVNAAVFVGATDRVATAAADDVLRIWEPGSPDPPRQLHGHAGPIWVVASMIDGGRLATGSADGTVRIWDGSGEPANVLAESDRVLTAEFSGDGSLLATGLANGSVMLRNAATLTDEGRLSVGGGRVNGMAFLADSSTVAVASDDGCVTIWDAAAHERRMSIAAHAKRVYCVSVSPDGSRVATAGEDRTARLWNAATGEAIGGPLKHPRRVFCAVFTTDGRRVVTACEDRLVRVWDAADGRERGRWEGHAAPVNWVAASADGQWIASAGSDATVRLWRARDGRPGPVLTGPAKQIWKCAFSPDASRIAGVSADGAVQLWDVASGRPALMLRGHGDQVWAVAFSPDGASLVTGGWDGTTRLWGVSPAEIVRRRNARP